MAMSLRPLGWMATLFLCLAVMDLAYVDPGLGRMVGIVLAVAALAALWLLVLLDVLQRRDLAAGQKLLWGLLGLLSPVGPGVYYVVRRRLARPAPPPRERPPSAYRVHDPFHRH